MRALTVYSLVALGLFGCAGQTNAPSSTPPPERSFSRPAADPAAALAAFVKHARAKGCEVEELAKGAIAHCPEAMIAVEPRETSVQVECRDKSPTECGPIFDAIEGTEPAPTASASASEAPAPAPASS